MDDPRIVEPEEWRRARTDLLAEEKELTRLRDRVNADRRRLPMVEIDREYVFEGAVSRGPFADLDTYRTRMGWSMPWYSSFGSTFNYDFHVTIDPDVAPVEYNFGDAAALERDNPAWVGWKGEQPGTSAFLRRGDRVFHTYSSYARGGDLLIGTYNWLDLTTRGRQEDWEEPAGRADSPGIMGWLHRHDEYPDDI